MYKYIIITILCTLLNSVFAKEVSYIKLVKNFAERNNINLVIAPMLKDFTVVLEGKNISNKNDLFNLITMLGAQNYIAITTQEDEKHIVLSKARNIRYKELPIIKSSKDLPNNHSFVRYLYNVKHVYPKFLFRNIRPLLNRYGRITPNSETRQIIISDTAVNIKKILDIFNMLDTPKAHKDNMKIGELNKQFKEKAKQRESFIVTLSKHQVLFIILFSLIFLIIGFMSRGYLIKKIEGGL